MKYAGLVILCSLVIAGSVIVAVVTKEPLALWAITVTVLIIYYWPETR